ncbi:MAG: glycosyltransferase family 2 protein [Elusimicrobia bacterium]|nr:glycosyltransferase family 2 protein [Elusimicrobiota bacterium]
MTFFLLPCYNEEKSLKAVLEEFKNINTDFEICIVDDGSQDATNEVAKNLKEKFNLPVEILKHKKNQGLGSAIKTGFGKILKRAKEDDFVVVMDADGTHPLSVAQKMINVAKKQNCDIVIASRFKRGGMQKGVSFVRGFLSRLSSFFLKLFFGKICDWTSGFRVYRAGALKRIFKKIRQKQFTVQVEILFLAKKQNLKICEVPLQLNYKLKKSPSKLRLFSLLFSYLQFFTREVWTE